jgi:glutathione S-transferase
MALTLYHVTWCPECARVREKLTDLNLAYEDVIVPDFRPSRQQVFEVSGQYYVPVLTDGDMVLTETRDILAHLDQRYDKGDRQEPGAGARDRAAGTDGEDDTPCCSL